jgi:hypothetical protein
VREKNVTNRFLIVVVSLAILIAVTAQAAEVKPTPIQNNLKASILALGSSDDFGKPASSKTKAPAGDFGSKRKSTAKAFLLSALVPGGGQYYLGHRSRARFFFAGEGVSWIGFLSFRLYGHWQKEDMIRFANERAGAQLEGKSNEMQDFVGFYTDIDDYNRAGRATDPQRPYLADIPTNHWRWLSASDQTAFRSLKNSSRSAYRRANFMIGMMLVNRLVSLIDVYRIVRRSHGGESFSQEAPQKVRFEVNPFASTRQVSLTVMTPF